MSQPAERPAYLAKFLAGTLAWTMAAILCGCGNTRKISASEREANPPDNNEADRSAYQIELKRNWSFGFENYKGRRYQDVPHFFWRVVEMDTAKSFVDVYSFLANTYVQLGKLDSALLVYQLGIRALPENPNLFRGVAALFAVQDRKLEAIAQYQKLVELETAEENDYRKLAELYLAGGDKVRAIQALEKVQELVPQDLEVRQQLSLLYPAVNDHSLADLGALELQQQQSPNDAPTLLALGKLYYYLHDYAKCVAILELYVAAAPEDFYNREYLGRAYFEMKKYREAIDQFNIIVAKNSEHAEAWALLARSAKELKDWPDARRYAHRALAIDNKFGFAYLALGEIYEQAARECLAASGGPNDFSSKLVFKLAYEQYEKALLDSKWQGEARRRMSAIGSLLPDEGDYFMNKNQDRPEGECYRWIYK